MRVENIEELRLNEVHSLMRKDHKCDGKKRSHLMIHYK